MKKLMAFLGIAVLTGALGYMIFAQPVIPLLDANRQVLAESYLDAFCAGQVYAQNKPQPTEAARCRSDLQDAYPTERDLEVVQEAACVGVGVPAEQLMQCIQFLKGSQYWITKDAILTNSWNSKFPYPLESNLLTQESNGRTEDRSSNNRTGDIRE